MTGAAFPRDRILVPVCLALGALFFFSLGDLWPLARLDLVVPPERLRNEGRAFLESMGFDLDGYRSASRLVIDNAAVDHVERTFGREATQGWIADGPPLVYYRTTYKKPGETIWYTVYKHPEKRVLGWAKVVQDDYPGERIGIDAARALANRALAEGLGIDPAELEERSASTTENPDRRTHRFGFERLVATSPELRERVTVTVAGTEVIGGSRRLVVPEPARRQARAREAPAVALETAGFVLLAAAAAAAFFIFLSRLRGGAVRIGRAAVWPGLVFVCLMGTFALETSSLFDNWEPLWPRWVSDLRYLSLRAIEQTWLVLVLLAVVAAGDALDRECGGGRGAALWRLGRGRLLDPLVARASARGFVVGLLCGGVLAASVRLLEWLAGAATALQPRGFFFYTLNSASPAVTSLLFFFGVALAEELGYRFFGGSWMLTLTRRPWVAIVVPAVIYGLTHTRMDFLPPSEPFWARPLVLTLVGCAWGWAFLRYDALTVVLSHFTADLFIFNWPRLASGETAPVVASLVVVCVPLLPALGYAASRLVGRPRPT